MCDKEMKSFCVNSLLPLHWSVD